METTQRTVESRVLGEQLTFIKTGGETNGELLEMEACYTPNQFWEHMMLHYHPNQDESFEVLEGVMTVDVNGVRRTYVAGERFDVPRNTVHGMQNMGTVPARMRWQVRPALETQEFFETVLPLADAGELFKPERISELSQRFGHVFRLAEPGA